MLFFIVHLIFLFLAVIFKQTEDEWKQEMLKINEKRPN